MNPLLTFSHLLLYFSYKAFANVIAGKDTKVWIVRGEEFRVIMAKPEHANEMMNMLTKLLRKASKIVRATLKETGVRAGGPSGEGNGRTFRIMCYDATSWVREVSALLQHTKIVYAKICIAITTMIICVHTLQNFEPQVEKFNNDAGKKLKLQIAYTNDRLDIKTAKYATGYDAVCLFVNDVADSDVMWILSMGGVKVGCDGLL